MPISALLGARQALVAWTWAWALGLGDAGLPPAMLKQRFAAALAG